MKKKVKKRKIKKEYYETKKYHLIMDILSISAFVIPLFISILSLKVSLIVRKDTGELAKFSAKPVYYDIKLYTNNDTRNSAIVKDKYLSLNLKLDINAFKIKQKDSIDMNYNAIFTKIKYFMVYNYKLENKDYKYMAYSLDDKTQAQLVYDDDLYSAISKMNYSLTPNKEYCYILIYTETILEKNLDLIFFKYNDKGQTFTLDTIIEDGIEQVNINRIDYDTLICKDYFVDLWSENDSKKIADLNFIFDVYEDLRNKKI